MTVTKSNSALYNNFVPKNFSTIVDNFFKESENAASNHSSISFYPKVDIAETELYYEVSVLLAGICKEDIKIEFQDDKLTISGERKLNTSETGKKYHKIETQYGTFQRTFVIPDKTNIEAIEATFENGILKITIPKDEKKSSKTSIAIK